MAGLSQTTEEKQNREKQNRETQALPMDLPEARKNKPGTTSSARSKRAKMKAKKPNVNR